MKDSSSRYSFISIITSLILICVGCSHAEETTYKKTSHSNTYNGYMGFTPWPYDLTEQAVNDTYNFINSNATIISHHLDGGVPWTEALQGAPLPKHLLSEWQKRKQKTGKHLKTFLSITPVNFARDGIASYWGDKSDNQPLPKQWANKSLDDPAVIQAYKNYVSQAVAFFQPDFLAIGIEANMIITKAPEKWSSYLALNKATYMHIKTQHPNLPVFSTVQYEHLRGIEDESKKNHPLQKSAVSELMKHSDILALSTYKYGLIHPNKISDNYFDTALSFRKPIAIAETGAMSETTLVMGIPLISNQKDQAAFIDMILNNASKYNFAFVINWVPIDFDPMIKKLPKEFRGIAKAWVHTGLLNKKQKEKPAFKIWKKHLK